MERRQFLTLAGVGLGSMLIAPRIVFANVETDRRSSSSFSAALRTGWTRSFPMPTPPTANCAARWLSTIR